MDFNCGHKPTQKQQPSRSLRTVLSDAFPIILSTIGLLLLTAIAISAAYKARRDPWTIAFVVPAYINLMLLFWCFRAFEKLPPEAPTDEKESLKLAIWVLATTLNLLFACRSSEIMPGFIAVTFWVLSVFFGLTGFLVLFIYRDPNANSTTNSNLQNKNCNNNKACSNVVEVSPEQDRV